MQEMVHVSRLGRTLLNVLHGRASSPASELCSRSSGRSRLDPMSKAPSPRKGLLRVVLHTLRFCRVVDVVNEGIGRSASWLVLLAVIIGSGNAVVRYLLDTSSNAWLEMQWYLFAAIVMLCAGYTLLRNEHIRIDIISARLPSRVRSWIDILGGIFFLLPACLIIGFLSWPVFVEAYVRHEMSGDAGGLLRWPVKLLIPIGFLLLALQGVSEILKRVAFLMGVERDMAELPADQNVSDFPR
jgi:TRAP-type mannitol/chloroaromatic compound transport system permease small subunit